MDARITALEGDASVYEVSGTTTIVAGELSNETLVLRCLDGDWRDSTLVDFVTVPPIFVESIVTIHDSEVVHFLDPVSETATGVALSKRIGISVLPELRGSGTPLAFDIDVIVTMLCTSPS